jgi:glycosyltransferase involved in cell wall biosynthesis
MERYVGEALRSLLGQSLTDLEVIVVDDGCTDGSLRVVEGFDDHRVRIIRAPHGRHQGLDLALNAGLAEARGTYIARQDADDVSLPSRLARQVAALAADDRRAAVGTAAELMDAEGRPMHVVRPPASDRDIRRTIAKRTPMFHGSVMMRRSALEAVGGYRAFYRCEDVDLWLRLLDTFRLANLQEALYRYRIHGHTLSRLGFHRAYRARRVAWELARQRGAGQAEDHTLAAAVLRGDARHVAVEAERDYRAQLGNLLLRQDRPLPALREYLRAIACRPLRLRSYMVAGSAILGERGSRWTRQRLASTFNLRPGASG